MAQVGVMIEAQEGLNWARWRHIVTDAERLGFASLRTSDHLQSVMGVDRESLSAWPALALAAEWTERIQLGPMVSPMTFYIPAVLGRIARAVDELSGGRLILGLGAGWNESEHRAFGIPLPGWRGRFDKLEEGIRRLRQTFTTREIPLLIGGGGERRTREITAREAAEWNFPTPDLATFREKSAALDVRCRELGREPSAVRRSIMRGYVIGRDEAELRRRVAQLAELDRRRVLRERGERRERLEHVRRLPPRHGLDVVVHPEVVVAELLGELCELLAPRPCVARRPTRVLELPTLRDECPVTKFGHAPAFGCL